MPDKAPSTMFISYCGAHDRAIIRDIVEQLTESHVNVWISRKEQIKLGDSLPSKIEEGLKNSRVLVCIISANAFDSDWTKLESSLEHVRNSLNKEGHILPIFFDSSLIKSSQVIYPSIDIMREKGGLECAELLEACGLTTKEASSITPHFVEVVKEKIVPQPINNDFSMIEVMEDLLHQLKSPILQAEFRSKRAAELASEARELKELSAIRGLCAKASRVLRQGSLLAQLHAGRPPTIRSSPILFDNLIHLLCEIATDAQLQFSHRNIKCNVERESFSFLNSTVLSTDLELLSVVLSNLLDNAFKYSFENTQIEIVGGTTSEGRYHISISNTGIFFDPQDVTKCFIRGWRGSIAKAVTSEGSGIGLWVSSQITQLLQGELEIIPTKDGITQVRLILPATS